MEKKTVLITGAARGQGRSHAVKLAEEGANIVALDICRQVGTVGYPMAVPEDLEETVRLVEKTGQRILAREVDVRDATGVKALVDDASREFGHIDAVCVNHGISGMAQVAEMTDVQWQEMLDVNLTGVFNTVRAVLPSMIDRRSGALVFTASVSAAKGYANNGHYSASKSGVVGLMNSLVNEVSQYGIRVNTILPGSIATPMIQNDWLYRHFDSENPTKERTEQIFSDMSPMPVSWMDPVEVSNAVLYLISDESRYVTGVSLPVDAGLLAKF